MDRDLSMSWCDCLFSEYIREEIVTLLAIQFNSIFAQICMEVSNFIIL